MKLETKWYLLLIIGFIIFYNLVQIVKKYDRHNNMYKRTELGMFKYNITYNEVFDFIDTIASYEGIVLKPYKQGKYYYIGCGHQMHGSDFNLKHIDTAFAKNLLLYDISKYLDETYTIIKLKGNKLLAITDFVYCYGSPTFLKSTLYKAIIFHSTMLIIKNQLIQWCYFNDSMNKLIKRRRYYDAQLYCKH